MTSRARTPVTHGIVNRALCLDGIVLTETTHPPGMTIPRHRHPHPAVTFVVRGAFTETFGAQWVHHCPATSLLFKPAGAEHANHYSQHGAHSFIIECTNEGELYEGLQRLPPQVGTGPLVGDALRVAFTYTRLHFARGDRTLTWLWDGDGLVEMWQAESVPHPQSFMAAEESPGVLLLYDWFRGSARRLVFEPVGNGRVELAGVSDSTIVMATLVRTARRSRSRSVVRHS